MIEGKKQSSLISTKIAFFDRTSKMLGMTPAQCRAARGLLRWKQDELASAAQVSIVTVRNFELEKSTPQRASLDVIRRALEGAGVVFIAENGEGPGVRMRKVEWRDSRQDDIPDEAQKVIVQYKVGPFQTQAATFNRDDRTWVLADSDLIVREADAGLWAVGPWIVRT